MARKAILIVGQVQGIEVVASRVAVGGDMPHIISAIIDSEKHTEGGVGGVALAYQRVGVAWVAGCWITIEGVVVGD